MNSPRAKSLIVGILLGALSVIALGQRSQPSDPGRFQAVAGYDGHVYVIDTATGRMLRLQQGQQFVAEDFDTTMRRTLGR